ncbi:MAG: valyl-tRNA synthetase [Candidatus Deianiraeaceae bacterium]|jgi:valyl-tRNA synthetase
MSSDKSEQKKLSKFFDFTKKEYVIHTLWESKKIYHFQTNSHSEIFSIDTPPPTVSGQLHMGHIFSYVQADIIARYNRISGKNVFYPIGFDDNGLPTERLVEKQTGKKVGINCTKDEFTAECYETIKDIESKFETLFRSMGVSYDWSLKYQTISKATESIVLQSFSDLYSKGLVYLKNSPVYWDVEDKTALAQADIEEKEMESCEYYIPFSCTVSGKSIEIMTTRPELLPACVAVLYHPADKRFTDVKTLKSPLFSHLVPFIADETVKMDKGTGVVMCCSYGDWTDVEWIAKHKLTPKVLIQENGEMCHEFFQNIETGKFLRTVNARKKTVDALKDKKLITKENKIMHSVKCGERSGRPLEIIHQRQMYIETIPFKNFLLNSAEEISFTPSHMKTKLLKWIEGLNQDWCISRNRYFGIEIPYYVCTHNNKRYEFIFPQGIHNSQEVGDVQKNSTGYTAKYYGDIDELKDEVINLEFQYVFDTWFTSSLTPQIAKGSLLAKNLPFSLRTQAHEIIRTWAFYTLLKSTLHSCNTKGDGQSIGKTRNTEFAISENILQKKQHIPWENIALSGWCLASDKSKMSKSKGNAPDPTSLIKKHGSDVIRHWCSSTPLGTDSTYSEDRLEIGKRFTTKLWNCLKFATQNECPQHVDTVKITHETDLWIIDELKKSIREYSQKLNEFKYFHARKAIDGFFWNTLCDNYLEFIKVRYYGTKAFIYKDANLSQSEITTIENDRQSAIHTLYLTLQCITVAFSPYCPFICEEIHQMVSSNKSPNIQNSLNDSMETLHKVKAFSGNSQEWIKAVAEVRKCKQDGLQIKYNDTHLPDDIKRYINNLIQ